MKALKFIKHPVNHRITILLPESFEDDDVEVIVRQYKKNDKTTKDIEKFCGFLKEIDMDVDKEIRKMRQEWERDF